MTPDLNAFEGLWTISRQIEDRRAGAEGQLVGTARFTAVTSGLRYDEEGQLNLPGAAPMTARRRYFWQQGHAGIDVSFDVDSAQVKTVFIGAGHHVATPAKGFIHDHDAALDTDCTEASRRSPEGPNRFGFRRRSNLPSLH